MTNPLPNLPHEAILSDTSRLQDQLVDHVKYRIVPGCLYCAAPCGHTNNYDMQELQTADEAIRSLKLRTLSGIRGLAAAAAALSVGVDDRFFYRALDAIGEDWDTDALLPIATEIEEILGQMS